MRWPRPARSCGIFWWPRTAPRKLSFDEDARAPAHRMRAARGVRGRPDRARRRHHPRRAGRGRSAARLARLRPDRGAGRADERQRRVRAPLAGRGEAADPRGRAGRDRLLGRLPGRAAAGIQPGRARLRRAAAGGGRAGVTLTDEGASDPVFAGLPRELATLQWHGDTFDLPEGAVLLAESPAYPHQAFRYGRAAYGVRFHVEVTGDMAREWA